MHRTATCSEEGWSAEVSSAEAEQSCAKRYAGELLGEHGESTQGESEVSSAKAQNWRKFSCQENAPLFREDGKASQV